MGRSVLVVEDDALIRAGMIALLRSRGHRPVGTATVAEALARLDDLTTPAHGAPPAAAAASTAPPAPPAPAAATAAAATAAPLTHVFLDLNLPDGSGTDV